MPMIRMIPARHTKARPSAALPLGAADLCRLLGACPSLWPPPWPHSSPVASTAATPVKWQLAPYTSEDLKLLRRWCTSSVMARGSTTWCAAGGRVHAALPPARALAATIGLHPVHRSAMSAAGIVPCCGHGMVVTCRWPVHCSCLQAGHANPEEYK